MHISAAMIRRADEDGNLPELAAICAAALQTEYHRLDAQMQRFAGNPLNEALPFRDGKEDFATVEANIPSAVALAYEAHPEFGPDYLKHDLKHFLRNNPQCRVKTISGKITSGYGSKTPARRRVVFGRNTIQFAT